MNISPPKDRDGWIRRVLTFLSVFVALSLATGVILPVAQADCTDASAISEGCWQTRPELMPINPIHLGMLHTGKVLVLSGSGALISDLDEHILKAAVWTPQTGAIVVQDLQYDLWCNGMAFLPDGRALIVGGTISYAPFEGEARASIFDPLTEQFIQVQSMQHGRWYATVTALGDGRLLTFSGFDEANNINSLIEEYKTASGWAPHTHAPWSPIPLYPWLHLLPDGRLFYSGYTNDSRFYDRAAQSPWSDPPIPTIFGQDPNHGPGRVYGSSVLLPLQPPLYTPRVMNLGGAPNPDGSSGPVTEATKTTEIIDLSQTTPAWVSGPEMSAERIHMNAVLLPTGKVLALGGSAFGEDAQTAAFQADLIDPNKDPNDPTAVVSAGVASFARLYHSMAMLLPDATVLVAGSNPVTFVNREFEQHIEIYSPAYLFTSDGNGGSVAAPRPIINSAPSIIGYGGTDFQVQVGNSDVIGSVVLMRPGSPTHAFDMEQRLVGLNFSPGAAGVINVTPPPATNANGANIAPPGYYMLFVLNSAGVPSVAKFIQLSLNPDNLFPEGTITSPANDVTIQTGGTLTFAGTATNPHNDNPLTFSWVFPDVVPDSDPRNTQQNPGAITFPTAGTYVVSLTVADNHDASDPNPPTRTITVVDPVPVTLTIAKTGTGSGTVTSNPAGIDCGGTCSSQYPSNAPPTLTATANSGAVFTGWSGGWCSGTGTCTPTLNTDPTTVTANFNLVPPSPITLNISKTGAGSGTVTSDLAGIDCGSDCTEVYNAGTSVTLTATAANGSTFNGWGGGGGCSGTGTCAPTLTSSPTNVTANFIITPVTLNITTSGAGSGNVTSSPAGINCGATCSKIYNFGQSVTLTATAANSSSAFNGWSGGGCSGTGTCTPTLNSDPITVNAEFISVPPLTLATSPLPDAEVGVSYNSPLVSGGLPPYTITPTKGAYPSGLQPDSNGALGGMPMSTKSRSFTVQVNYLSGSPVTGSFKITVRKAVGIATKTLKAGTHGVALSRTLKASGGKAPYSWSLVQGSSLPPGLSLSSAGAITGVVDPTAIGLYNFTVQVTDPLNGTFQKSLSLTIK